MAFGIDLYIQSSKLIGIEWQVFAEIPKLVITKRSGYKLARSGEATAGNKG
jgi:hypothetical protein